MNKNLIWDTRQQAGKHEHILQWFEENGYSVLNSKLPFGDVCYVNDLSRIIDTKKDLQEVIGNVTAQHERFIREIELANENGIKLYFLIQDENISELRQVNQWWNPRLKYNKKATKGTTLFKILYSIEKKYNTKFFFCTREKCGETIIKILDGEIS